MPTGGTADRDGAGKTAMNAPNPPPAPPASSGGPVRRIVASVILGCLVILVLWLAAFSMLTSLLIGAGVTVVIVAGSAVSDVVETVLDAIASIVFGIFALIAAIVAAIFSLFS